MKVNLPETALVKNKEVANHSQADKLEKVCRRFEALLVERLLEAMDRTTFRSAETAATELYRDMYYMELARLVSENFQLGIAEKIYQQLQEQKLMLPGGDKG
ncbi:rod-binding protein [Calderihabitans maritimus]|uniref:FlgJ-like flagellar muramidase protein n=1 Tax=Calderihabitans maritimus TaxID=1246530 RepID=A0A1Z5HUE1_9FIRM|nr:rod-binding protein [Calderihabitans maritimus]GAW92945.1 FlgJ-like flagellar muramidase protein [Calderihabitans maritimus]